jgi:micrococcal nuclease
MLNSILVILFLLSLLLLVWGLISPKSLSNEKHQFTRKEAGWTFGILTLIFFILVGITAPEPEKQEPLNQASPQPTTTEQKPEIKDEPTEEELAELEKEKQRNYWHRVVRVIDGDTVKAEVDGKTESIRLVGIDAPEFTSKTECFGKRATDKAKEFLEGKWIQLEKDESQSDRDKYGRLLRYVWFDEGTDFGKRIIEEGYAYEYTYNTPYDKQDEYKETQKYAKSKSHGLWSSSTCNGKKQKPAPKPQSNSSPAPSPQPAPRPISAPQPRPAASAPSSSGVVKKSTSDICHAPGTTYYSRTTNFTPYNSVQACLNSGGRLPLR